MFGRPGVDDDRIRGAWSTGISRRLQLPPRQRVHGPHRGPVRRRASAPRASAATSSSTGCRSRTPTRSAVHRGGASRVLPAAFPAHATDDRAGADTGRRRGLNVEQPGSEWFEVAWEFARRARHVFDISPAGVAEFQRRGVPAVHVPLGYTPSLEAPALRPTAERPIDVLFFGHASARRNAFFARHADFFSAFNCHIVVSEVHRPAPAPRRGLSVGRRAAAPGRLEPHRLVRPLDGTSVLRAASRDAGAGQPVPARHRDEPSHRATPGRRALRVGGSRRAAGTLPPLPRRPARARDRWRQRATRWRHAHAHPPELRRHARRDATTFPASSTASDADAARSRGGPARLGRAGRAWRLATRRGRVGQCRIHLWRRRPR